MGDAAFIGSIRQLTVDAFCGNVRGHNKFPCMGI
jgi:hypothetical protein